MGLSSELISQFVKATKDTKETKTETKANGVIVEYNGTKYVRLDGSELLTPISTTVAVDDGERVTVTIKDHTATVDGNTSSPAGKDKDVQEIGSKITEFEIVIADKVSTKEFDAEVGRIDDLVSDNVLIKNQLTAAEGYIEDLKAKNVEIEGKLTADEAEIENLKTTKLDADVADLTYATIENLEATNADLYNLKSVYGEFEVLSTTKFTAIEADIENLETTKLSAEQADLKYANIDFSNIGKATMEYFYAQSGLIRDVMIGDGTITGHLVGVTISGDLIEGNTLKADKLVLKGEDGLYYKLNIEGGATSSELVTDEQLQNGLSGSIIIAKSITAEQISVDDLVAFDATIGGFNITESAIYSGVKSSVNNTTRGLYMDNTGQWNLGDSSNFIKYYKDSEGKYRLEISAESIKIKAGSSQTETTVEDAINNIQNQVNDLKDEITTLLRIESSRGTVFKNNSIATVLSVVIYHGTQRITDSATMKTVFGDGAYLQWYWQRIDDDTYGVMSSSDSRFGDNGFTLTISPEDVDDKVTFMCELIV